MTIAEERSVEKTAAGIAQQVLEKFQRDVVRVRFQIEEDWTGESVLYFRVTLKDSAVRGARLGIVANAVREEIRAALRESNVEGTPSVRFRGESEQVGIQDAKWQ